MLKDLTDFLTTVTPFSALTDDARGEVARRLKILYHRAGESIGEYGGEAAPELFILRKGAVELLDKTGQALERRGEGELFGHAIEFSPPQPRYRVRAIEDCLLWWLDAEALGSVRKAHPVLAEFLEQGHGDRLRGQRRTRSGAERVGQLPLRTPVVAAPQRSIADCARTMAEAQASCLPIVEAGRLIGILTDRDLRNRVVAERLEPDTAVAEVMTRDPATVDVDTRIEDALVEMMRLGIHHLPVLGETGELAGVVSAGDLMRVQAPHPLRLVRDIQRAESVDELVRLARQGPAMLAGLVRGGSGAAELGRIAGRITDACTLGLLRLAEAELGPAPMAWSWLAFGSQARLEQGLISDQDNGLLLAEEPDAQAADYFLRLAEFVCDGLHACGYVHCPGGVMAKGEWRMSRAAWRRRFDGWMREPEPKSVMQSSIFFDLRAVAGDAAMASDLHREVLAQARESDIFRRFLAAESMQHRPPIGLFRQFVQEHGGSEHSQGLNLKKRGVIPIVDLARVRALEGALEAIHTEERIQAAAEAGQISPRDAGDLIHALKFIGDIRLEHQVRQLEAGRMPDHLVAPDELSGLHRRYLRSAFGIVDNAQKALAQRYLL
jgi:CBS domain-containing protein